MNAATKGSLVQRRLEMACIGGEGRGRAGDGTKSGREVSAQWSAS